MGRAERRAQARATGQSVQEMKRSLLDFARRGERYATTLGQHLPAEWVRFNDGMGPYWRRGAAQVRATLEAPDATGVALAAGARARARGRDGASRTRRKTRRGAWHRLTMVRRRLERGTPDCSRRRDPSGAAPRLYQTRRFPRNRAAAYDVRQSPSRKDLPPLWQMAML